METEILGVLTIPIEKVQLPKRIINAIAVIKISTMKEPVKNLQEFLQVSDYSKSGMQVYRRIGKNAADKIEEFLKSNAPEVILSV